MIFTITNCVFIITCFERTWFSYILFIVLIGGLLVLFIYVSSLASNEKFFYKFKSLLLIRLIRFILLVIYLYNYYYIRFYISNYEIQNINLLIKINENYLRLYKIYNVNTNIIRLFIFNYLLIAIIVITKITNLNIGPLRTTK